MITSGEMVRRIAKRRKIPAEAVRSVLVGLAEEITASMCRSEDVTLWGIGRFKRRCFRTTCVTPKTKAKKQIANGVSFVASTRIKTRLKKGLEIFDEVEAL